MLESVSWLRYMWAVTSPAPHAAVRLSETRLLWVLQLAAGAGAAMAGYLWWLRVADMVRPGCHAGGDCSYLWFSNWASWFGLPVSALALIPYALVLLGTVLVRREQPVILGRKLLAGVAVFLVILVCWFMILQGAVLKHWCRLCLLSHALSTMTAVMVVVWLKITRTQAGFEGWFPGQAAFTGLALGLAAIAAHSMTGSQTTDAVFRPLPDMVLLKRDGPQRVRLLDQPLDLAKDVLRVSGSWEAREVIVTLFDYTCPDCRRLHGQLRQVTASAPGRYCEVGLLAPLNSGCNPAVVQDDPLHRDACRLAQIACVVGHLRPAEFPAFHEWMMTGEAPPSVDAAIQRAQTLLPAVNLPEEMAKPENLRPLALGVSTFRLNLKNNHLDGLPLLLTERSVFIGAPQNIDTLARYFR